MVVPCVRASLSKDVKGDEHGEWKSFVLSDAGVGGCVFCLQFCRLKFVIVEGVLSRRELSRCTASSTWDIFHSFLFFQSSQESDFES